MEMRLKDHQLRAFQIMDAAYEARSYVYKDMSKMDYAAQLRAKDLLGFLLGSNLEFRDGDYIIKEKYRKHTKRTVGQRINLFWVWPTFLTLAPFRYIIFGHYHVDEDSRLGKVLNWLVGDY